MDQIKEQQENYIEVSLKTEKGDMHFPLRINPIGSLEDKVKDLSGCLDIHFKVYKDSKDCKKGKYVATYYSEFNAPFEVSFEIEVSYHPYNRPTKTKTPHWITSIEVSKHKTGKDFEKKVNKVSYKNLTKARAYAIANEIQNLRDTLLFIGVEGNHNLI
ncbi:MAG: hypothetical protein KJ767_03970 [Nanoarchaeota archaeon]|nr:hypothetical protein [Nanoarchaeota archaeon]